MSASHRRVTVPTVFALTLSCILHCTAARADLITVNRKVIRSALANAEEKNNRDKAGIDVDNLVVGRITVDQGPSMWRIRPRAQGRASWIQHKTSHVEVVLSEE